MAAEFTKSLGPNKFIKAFDSGDHSRMDLLCISINGDNPTDFVDCAQDLFGLSFHAGRGIARLRQSVAPKGVTRFFEKGSAADVLNFVTQAPQTIGFFSVEHDNHHLGWYEPKRTRYTVSPVAVGMLAMRGPNRGTVDTFIDRLAIGGLEPYATSLDELAAAGLRMFRR